MAGGEGRKNEHPISNKGHPMSKEKQLSKFKSEVPAKLQRIKLL